MSEKFRILVLDDEEARHRMLRSFAIGSDFWSAWNVEQAIELLQKYEFNQIFLDHDLATDHYLEGYRNPDTPVGKYDTTTGYAVAKYLAENPEISPSAEIIVHTQNHWGGTRMLQILYESGRKVTFIPFCDLVKRVKKTPDWQFPR